MIKDFLEITERLFLKYYGSLCESVMNGLRLPEPQRRELISFNPIGYSDKPKVVTEYGSKQIKDICELVKNNLRKKMVAN